jgi:hypothetical protein
MFVNLMTRHLPGADVVKCTDVIQLHGIMIAERSPPGTVPRVVRGGGMSLAVAVGFLTKFRFAKFSRNWLRYDFRVSRK